MEPKDLGHRIIDPENTSDPLADLFPEGDEPEGDDLTPKKQETTNQEPAKGYTEREKQLYARLKKVEDEKKAYKEKFQSLLNEDDIKQKLTEKPESTDPYGLAKTVAALKNYDDVEIDFASTLGKAMSKSPQEVVKTQEFKFWLKGKRDKDLLDNNIPSPNSSSPSLGLPNSDEIGKMSKEEHQKLEKEFQNKRKGSGF